MIKESESRKPRLCERVLICLALFGYGVGIASTFMMLTYIYSALPVGGVIYVDFNHFGEMMLETVFFTAGFICALIGIIVVIWLVVKYA